MTATMNIADRPSLLLCTLWLGVRLAVPEFTMAAQDAPDPLPSEPVFDAMLSNGSIITGRIRSMSFEGPLELVDEQGEDRIVEGEDLVKLSRHRSVVSQGGSEAPLVVLPLGDQIRGQLDAADEQTIELRSSIFGALSIPLDAVVGFSITPALNPQAEATTIRSLRDTARASDRLFLVNGDERDVTFSAVGESEVAYLDANRLQKLPKEMVQAVGLDPGLLQIPESPDRSFDFVFTDGSRLRLIELSIREGRLKGKTSIGVELDAPIDRIASCYALNERIVYLSEREAAREVTVPYVGPARPVQTNTTVFGNPITVNGRQFLRGLGTQSRSLLAYQLQPEDQRFQARLALDDIAGPLGNVVFRVLVDGEERYASPPVTSGVDPIAIDVDVSGGKFLILATEFGPGGGIRDYAVWIDARLIREFGDTEPPVAGN
ncbi:NPCBM/NEW2 domain-containing protein [Tautonia marina]|uniref:NPCBM/NEW2 domain-containing protein n=1 Tax=Tautonia marina TaxID=2653855 RepID=UPI0012607335|nr:NPCBM/NEW2 domain-containing protein [Tautonia marina]